VPSPDAPERNDIASARRSCFRCCSRATGPLCLHSKIITLHLPASDQARTAIPQSLRVSASVSAPTHTSSPPAATVPNTACPQLLARQNIHSPPEHKSLPGTAQLLLSVGHTSTRRAQCLELVDNYLASRHRRWPDLRGFQVSEGHSQHPRKFRHLTLHLQPRNPRPARS